MSQLSGQQWLSQCINDYRERMNRANAKLYKRETAFVKGKGETRSRLLDEYIHQVIHVARLAQDNGDDYRQFWTLRRAHDRLLELINTHTEAHCFRCHCLHQCRKTLVGLCAMYQQCETGQEMIDTLNIEFEFARDALISP
uniref:hypothetical protein n=1 Tax=Thaumasiovibrio occultus TaxID=1891184 RepID=UPI000B35E62F|nr:hypothetical protein [Thaumasiovibrio occultus]